MTTVVDPLGTPTVYFNKSGTAITTVACTNATTTLDSGAAGTNIVLFDFSDNDAPHLVLPSGTDVGDVFHLVPVSGGPGPVVLIPPSGDHLNGVTTSVRLSGGITVRKTSTTQWYTFP